VIYDSNKKTKDTLLIIYLIYCTKKYPNPFVKFFKKKPSRNTLFVDKSLTFYVFLGENGKSVLGRRC
jgi:hypothetical protein